MGEFDYIELKIAPLYFKQQLLGLKNFEIRKNNRPFEVGKYLSLAEYENGEFTGRAVTRVITCITDYAQRDGYVVLGTKAI